MLRKLALSLCLMGTTLSAFAGDVLRYRTATTIKVGPLAGTQVIEVNGNGPNQTWTESFTVDATVLLSKNGGKLEEVDVVLTLDSYNLYDLTLSAEMTGTYGRLDIVVINGDKVLRESYGVINGEVWDEQHSAPRVGAADVTANVVEWNGTAVTLSTGLPKCSMDAISGDTTAADNAELAFDGSGYGFPNSTMPTVTTVTNGVTLGANALNSATLDTSAVDEIVDQVWNETASGHTNPGSFGDHNRSTVTVATINTGVITAASIATDAIGAAEIATSAIGSLEIASNAIGSAEIATGAIGELELHASAVDEIVVDVKTELDTHGAGSWVDTGGGDATEAKQDTIIAYIDTEVAAILQDTGTTLDNYIDNEIGEILTDTGTTIPGTITTIDTEVGQIKAVTDNLPDSGALTTIGTDTARLTAARAGVLTDWINGGRLDLLLDAVYTGTPPTVAQIRSEMDSNSTDFNTLITGVNLTKINGTSIAGAGSQVADRWVGFWNQASAGYSVATALSSFKATGFSTHSAADVWTAGSRALSTPADYKATGFSTHSAANVWSVGTRKLSGTYGNFDELLPRLDTEHGDGSWVDAGGGDATEAKQDTIISALTTIDNYVDGEVQAILDDTNELQTDDVPGLIAALENISTAQVYDEVEQNLVDYNLDHLAGTAVDIPAAPAGTYIDTIIDDTNELQADWVNAGRLDNLLDAVYTGTPPTVAQIRTEMDNNSSDLNDILTDTGTTLNTHLTDIKGGTFSGATDSLEAIRDQGDAAWTTGSGTSTLTQAQVNSQVDTALSDINLDHLMKTAVGNNADMTTEVTDGTVLSNVMSATSDTSTYVVADDSLEGISGAAGGATNPNMLLSTTVSGAPASQTQFVLAAGSDDNDAYKSVIIVLYDVDNNNYPSVRTVMDYIGSSKTVVIDAAPDFTLADTDAVKIFIADRTLDQASAIDGKTMRQVLRYLSAVIAGETSGAGTGTEVFKGLDGLTDRVQVTIDVNGDRTTINYDP